MNTALTPAQRTWVTVFATAVTLLAMVVLALLG